MTRSVNMRLYICLFILHMLTLVTIPITPSFPWLTYIKLKKERENQLHDEKISKKNKEKWKKVSEKFFYWNNRNQTINDEIIRKKESERKTGVTHQIHSVFVGFTWASRRRHRQSGFFLRLFTKLRNEFSQIENDIFFFFAWSRPMI